MTAATRSAHLITAAFALVVLILPPAQAAPKADLWEVWTAHDPDSKATVDHAPWAKFLKFYRSVRSDGVAAIDYAGVSSADKGFLRRYVESLEATAVSRLNRQEQMAYWINFYNALTVLVIVDHWPVKSIRDIDLGGFFADGPWGKKLVKIEGREVSLDDMEHRILRPIWKDPRIHYAVNCASVGCPDIAPAPFRAAHLETMLDAAARAYVNHPRGAAIGADGKLTASKIYDWFEADFGGSEAGVLNHMRQFAEGEKRARLEKIKSIDGYVYDWSVNGPTGN